MHPTKRQPGIEMPPGAIVTGEAEVTCATCKKLMAARDAATEALDKMVKRAATAEGMLSNVQMDLRIMRQHLPSPYGQGVAEMIEAIHRTLHPKSS